MSARHRFDFSWYKKSRHSWVVPFPTQRFLNCIRGEIARWKQTSWLYSPLSSFDCGCGQPVLWAPVKWAMTWTYPFFLKLFVLLCFNTVAGIKLEHITEIVSILLSVTNIGMIRGKLQTFQCLKNKWKGKPKASCFLFATNQLRFPYNHSHLELAGASDNPWGFIRCWDKENTIVFVLFFLNNDLCVYFILWICMHQSVFTCIPWV